MYSLNNSILKKHSRLFAFGSICLALSGCNDTAGTAPDSTEEKFTFKGELPQNFGITAMTTYYPINPNTAECQIQALGVGPGKFIMRRKGTKKVIPISGQPQSFSFDVPLKHTVEKCEMALGRFEFNIRAKFGEKDWQTTYANGGLRLNNSNDAVYSQAEETLYLNGKCSWLFKESEAHLELDKLLTCNGATAHISPEKLINKTIHINIQETKEERPYYRDTWIKFDNGWKPCLPNPGDSILCQTPPTFKKFKMDGKTCTIYPGCTE